MSRLATAPQLAAETGLDPKTVRAHLDRAGIKKQAGGVYARAVALKAIRAELDPSLEAGHAVGGRGNASSAEISTLSKAKAQAETFRARKLQQDVAIRDGKLVDRAQVREAGLHICTQARVAFMAIGRKLAPQLVNVADLQHIQSLIEAECRRALTDLADPDRFADEVLLS